MSYQCSIQAGVILSCLLIAGISSSQEEPSLVGINADLGVASTYIFRGANIFQREKQSDQSGALFPSLTWTAGDSGISLGYWGAYQFTGNNISDKIDAGAGAEQDLILKYNIKVEENTNISLGLVYYFFPFAKKEVAGTSVPSYLEPGITLTHSTVVDLNLGFSYFAGLQEEIKLYRYLYINPSIVKRFPLNSTLAIEPFAGFGYKLFNDRDKMKDNVYDIMLALRLPITTSENTYITPAGNFAWTNFESKKMGDEIIFWGSINGGVNF